MIFGARYILGFQLSIKDFLWYLSALGYKHVEIAFGSETLGLMDEILADSMSVASDTRSSVSVLMPFPSTELHGNALVLSDQGRQQFANTLECVKKFKIEVLVLDSKTLHLPLHWDSTSGFLETLSPFLRECATMGEGHDIPLGIAGLGTDQMHEILDLFRAAPIPNLEVAPDARQFLSVCQGSLSLTHQYLHSLAYIYCDADFDDHLGFTDIETLIRTLQDLDSVRYKGAVIFHSNNTNVLTAISNKLAAVYY